jgi:hypothetical protein
LGNHGVLEKMVLGRNEKADPGEHEPGSAKGER